MRHARQRLTRLEKLKHEHDKNWTSCYYYNLKGILELAEGKTDAAIESQQHSLVAYDFYGASDSLAAAYAAQGRWSDAVTFYKRYLDQKGDVIADDSPPIGYSAICASLKVSNKAGDLKESLKYYDEFLRLWADADLDLPVLHLAKDGRARVTGDFLEGPRGHNETMRRNHENQGTKIAREYRKPTVEESEHIIQHHIRVHDFHDGRLGLRFGHRRMQTRTRTRTRT